ncbi:SGNH/GDSL hydrolase family protein [Calothrix sp. 336/3]|uniref:SGNH/GDSL hydrolase family protein n=1 Tax=Calothrix sp. 336/3 TaxID=1337936 RepID=UPI0004E33B4F|nr:SGNH/GDSL hydrolase family protein [Calothrix sp. 336/3]AKG22695.1 hypothetical protein IJ00_16705 [Calothrix sp. 336/3]
MRDVYLLAAGLLTGFAVPVSTLTQLSLLESDNHSKLQWDVKEGIPASDDKTSNPLFTPEMGTSLPEFSQEAIAKPEPVSVRTSYQPIRKIASGSQLYYHRLAALKDGQIYTRLDESDLKALRQSKKQLTYEDWKSLLAMEGRAIAEGQGKNRLSVIVGDSLSMWFPREKLPGGKLWLNQGISGDTSVGIAKRLSAFAKTKPEVIYVMAGINDLRKGTTDEVILTNHRRIVRTLRQNHPRSVIILQSILPTRLTTVSNLRIRRLNYQLALIAQQEKANFINLYTWFADFQGDLREDLTTDGLHLSQEGYQVWQAALERVEARLTLAKISQQSKSKSL